MNAVCAGHTVAAPCSPEARRALTFWLVAVVPHRRLSKRGTVEWLGAHSLRCGWMGVDAQGTVTQAVRVGRKLLSGEASTLTPWATPDGTRRVTPACLPLAVRPR